MSNLAIIPARGGSKRIPRKNIKFFLGKPIISYSIEAAIKSKLFDEIIVSTDDEEIANIAIKFGANVPFFRSEKNSNDFATTMDVIQEVRMKFISNNIKFNNICCIYPTAPLIKFEDIIKGYDLLVKECNDLVYPVAKFSYPILRSLIIDEIGYLKMKWPEYAFTRSQDLPDFFHDSGQWYWYSDKSLSRNNFEKIKPIILDGMQVQDIDDESDFRIAEIKYKIINNKSNL